MTSWDSGLCWETTSASCSLCSKASSCFGEGFHAASILQYRFYLFSTVLFPVKGFFSDCLCSVRRALYFQPSSGKSELLTPDHYEACRSVGDLRLYLQFLSRGWTSLLWTTKIKSSTVMRKCFCLLSSCNLSAHQDHTPKSYWIHTPGTNNCLHIKSRFQRAQDAEGIFG